MKNLRNLVCLLVSLVFGVSFLFGAALPVAAAGGKVECKVVNKWKAEAKHYAQLEYVVSEITLKSHETYKITVELPEGTEIDSFWCCKCLVEGRTLQILGPDYARFRLTGKSRDCIDFGIIFKSNANIDVFPTGELTATQLDETF